jgi:hypothetical protein
MRKRFIPFLLLLAPLAQAQNGGIFAAPPPIASLTLSNTPANAVQPFYPGLSIPSSDFRYMPRHTNCGGGSNQQPCTAAPAGLSTEVPVQLYKNWTNLYSRPLFIRFESDEMNPWDWSCNFVPVGTPIRGTPTVPGLTWSTSGGTTTVYTTAAAPGGTFYVWGGLASDGFMNPSTPTAATTPYTVSSSVAGVSFSFVTGAAAGSGSDVFWWTLASQWYPTQLTAPTCASGAGQPPATAWVDGATGMIKANPLIMATVGADLQSAYTANGHYIGNMTGSGTFTGVVPHPAVSYPTVELPMWNTLIASLGIGGQILGTEIGNEPDNYTSQCITNQWCSRASFYGAYSSSLNVAIINPLFPGSGQTPTSGTTVYNITDTGPNAGGGTRAKIALTVTNGVCTAVSITTAGSLYFNQTLPFFDIPGNIPTIGTNCQLMLQSESWMNDFQDIVADLNANRITPPGGGYMNPSEATSSYAPQFYGSATNGSTTNDGYGPGGGAPPSIPNELVNMFPAGGLDGITTYSQHAYPLGTQVFCPAYPISSMTRVGNTFPLTSTTTVTTSAPTNFATTINLGGLTYSSSSGLVTASIADSDTIAGGHTWANNVVTMNVGSTPNVQVGEQIQTNGWTTDTGLNGQPLIVQSVGATSYTASWPLYTNSLADPGTGYDQPYIYSGATINVTGVADSTYNLSGVTIASINPKTRTAVNGVTGATFTYTTGSATLGASSTGGSFIMTGEQAILVTGTPIGVNGTDMQLLSTFGCQNLSSNAYVYPPYVYPPFGSATTSAYPVCGSHQNGYLSPNFLQFGAPTAITCSTPTTCTFQQTGAADSVASGTLELVTGTTSNTNGALGVVKAPNCNAQDVLTIPSTQTKGVALNAPKQIELDGLSIGTYTGGGGATPYSNTARLQYRIGEWNCCSPATHGISDSIQAALYETLFDLDGATWNGINGTLGSTGLVSPASSFPLSGFDGTNMHTGESTVYAQCTYNFTPITVGGANVIQLFDSTSMTGPACQGPYYGHYMEFLFMGAQGTTGNPTSWLPLTGTTVNQNLSAWAIQNSSLSDSHKHVMLINASEAEGGNVKLTTTGLTTGTATTLQATNSNFQIAPTLTTISGTTATFTVPCIAQPSTTPSAFNINFNMPFQLSGYSAAGIADGTWVTVATHTTATTGCISEPFTATVASGTPGSYSIQGVATEGCGPLLATNPYFCTWGKSISGLTMDGSYSGAMMGTYTPTPLTAVSNVFTVYVPPLSEVMLDIH